MELITPRLQLREFSLEDYPSLREMDSRPEMHTYEKALPGADETSQLLESFIKEQIETPRIGYRLAITIPPVSNVRGIIKLSRQWEAIREWEVGWAVHPDDWGKGYATEAAWYIMDWGFRELNIHRTVAYCHTNNVASVRVMEKLGMKRDGRLRETRWLDGEWWDEYVYAILEKEWVAS
jgi:[ribosomal protein S5]-alanine N-acetyltransferase